MPHPLAPAINGTRRRRALALSNPDWWMLLATGVLITVGMVSVYAATRNHLMAIGRPGNAYVKRDLLNLAVGLGLALPAARFDYRQLRPWSPVLYSGSLLMLLVVLTPLGSTVNGAHGWFSLGALQLEPSEFEKLALILLLAALLSERQDREEAPTSSAVMSSLAAAGVPILLVLAEPALGIAIVLAIIVITLLALSGTSTRWTLSLVTAGVVGAALAFNLHLLKPYQEQRFTAFTDPKLVSTSTGYQIEQSRIAIGSGGLFGQGLLHGSQTDGGFVPEQQTDFIFTVSAEEGGLLAGSLLLAALGLMLWRALNICMDAIDLFGRLIAGGIVAWFAFQSFVNIGMTLGIMPVTGLPLPFVSYGGSSLFADLLGIALLHNIRERALVSRSG